MSLNPQDSRSTKLKKELEISMPTGQNDIMNIKMVEEHYKEQVSYLKKENEHLKTIQLKYHKELLKFNHNFEVYGDTGDYTEPIPPWVVNSNYLSPLIEVYERSISELNVEIDTLTREFRAQAEVVQTLSTENLELRDQLEVRYNTISSKAPEQVGYGSLKGEEVEEYIDHIDKLTEENNNLVLLNERLQKRADDATKSLISRGKELEDKLAVWNDLESALQCTREREVNLKHQKEVLESKLSNTYEELGEIEKDRDTLYSKNNKLEKEYVSMRSRAEKYEQAYKSTEGKRNEEIEALACEIAISNSREKEAIQKSILYERENEELREMRKELENEISANRKEFEAMVRVMEDLENHLNSKTAREENLEVLMRENTRKTEEALMERDRATRREGTLLKSIEKLESELKQSSAETDSKHNSLMENMRNKHQSIVKTKDEEINDMTTKVTSLENQIERLERENRNYKNETTKYHQSSKQLLDKNTSKLEELEKKLVVVESERENLKYELSHVSEQLKEDKRAQERSNRALEQKSAALGNEVDSLRRDRIHLKDELKRMEFRAEELERERNMSLEEADNLRRLHTDKLNELISDSNDKNSKLERALREAQDRIRLSETRAKEIIKMQETLGDKWKKEHMLTVQYYENMLNDYQNELGKFKQEGATGGDGRYSRDYSKDYANK